MASSTENEMGGFEALGVALLDLAPHGLIAIGVSFFVAFASVQLQPKTNQGSNSAEFGTLFYYAAGFGFIGVVTAYFLQLGLNIDDQSEGNSLVATFATPFISLLTAGIAFMASKSSDEISGTSVFLGVISFLISCVLSYETNLNQTFESEVQIPVRVSTDEPIPVDTDSDDTLLSPPKKTDQTQGNDSR